MVGRDGTLIDIGYPQTISFQVTRGMIYGLPQAVIRIYNLSEDKRNNIFKDYIDFENYLPISLFAGYENEPSLPEIFKGNIWTAYSYREGVNWITEIRALDGIYGVQNGVVSLCISKTDFNARDVLAQIINTMPKLNIGAIGNITMDNTRGRVIFGNSWTGAIKFTEAWGQLFIDKEQIHFLSENEIIDDGLDPLTINSDSGLLKTPRRGDGTVEIEVLFSPEIETGRMINLKSKMPVYNGSYIVQGIDHRALISQVVSGEAVTTLKFLVTDPLTVNRLILPANKTLVPATNLTEGANIA